MVAPVVALVLLRNPAMPSPFPGMDPYLEDPGLWPDVHHRLISEFHERLNEGLRPKYYVRVEERVYISDENDPGRSVIVPELRVAGRPGHEGKSLPTQGESAVEVVKPVFSTTLIDEDIHEAYLVVIEREQRSVVTVIEVVSPTNKVAGSRGRECFEQKRKEVMNSPSHWVEIDLLRAGVRLAAREPLPACEYLVYVSEVSKRSKGLVWPIRLRQRLPVVLIPLKPEDQPVRLDLQVVLDTAYDRAGYDLQIDYNSDPVPPLPAEWTEWANRLLQGKGLRKP
jgi:hypothetical protein